MRIGTGTDFRKIAPGSDCGRRRQGIPHSFLLVILGDLRRAGMLASQRGTRGAGGSSGREARSRSPT